MSNKKHNYIWKDVVEIKGHYHAEEFPISGLMDGPNVYQIDDFLDAVAKKYRVTIDDVKTYMLHNIEFDASVLPFGAEDCGCYIDGVAEWLIPKNEKPQHIDLTKRLTALSAELDNLLDMTPKDQTKNSHEINAVYADMANLKDTLEQAGFGGTPVPRVVIDVKGGIVEAVYSNQPGLKATVRLLDYDLDHPQPSTAPHGMQQIY